MSEPLAERLSRFTPDAGALDRDALLFAAGRASVRPGLPWKILVGALAASQLLTLLALWPHTPPTASPVEPSPPVAVEPPPPSPADPGAWAASWRVANEPDYEPPAAAPGSLVPDDPPLRASGPWSALLN